MRLGPGVTPVAGHRGAVEGLETLAPELRRIVHLSPVSLTIADIVRSQNEVGAEQTVVDLLGFIKHHFPDWKPLEEDPSYQRAMSPLTISRQSARVFGGRRISRVRNQGEY